MGPRDRREFVPEDFPRPPARSGTLAKSEIFNALRVKLHFALVVTGETFQQFREGALGPVAAIHER